MTISFDETKIKRIALYIVWALVCAALLFASVKYLPFITSKAPAYAIVKTDELIKEEKERLIKDNFILYQNQTNDSIEQAARDYYARINRIAALIAKKENLIILDGGAVVGYPNGVIDVTPYVRKELENSANPSR
jgi:hypothetical protein